MNIDAPPPLAPNPPRHVVAAAGCVRNEAGRVLLVRSGWRGWEFPGGQVEQGEDLLTAVAREIVEESGLTVTVEGLAGIYSNVGVPYIVQFLFRCSYISGEPTPSAETPEVVWLTPDEALALPMRSPAKLRLRDGLSQEPGVAYRVYRTHPEYELIKQWLLPT